MKTTVTIPCSLLSDFALVVESHRPHVPDHERRVDYEQHFGVSFEEGDESEVCGMLRALADAIEAG